jgi:hypothetical protein
VIRDVTTSAAHHIALLAPPSPPSTPLSSPNPFSSPLSVSIDDQTLGHVARDDVNDARADNAAACEDNTAGAAELLLPLIAFSLSAMRDAESRVKDGKGSALHLKLRLGVGGLAQTKGFRVWFGPTCMTLSYELSFAFEKGSERRELNTSGEVAAAADHDADDDETGVAVNDFEAGVVLLFTPPLSLLLLIMLLLTWLTRTAAMTPL